MCSSVSNPRCRPIFSQILAEIMPVRRLQPFAIASAFSSFRQYSKSMIDPVPESITVNRSVVPSGWELSDTITIVVALGESTMYMPYVPS